MSNEMIVKEMVRFIEEKEKEALNDKLSTENKIKSDVVNAILNKLDGELANENK
mgnify:CR=1 FL=1